MVEKRMINDACCSIFHQMVMVSGPLSSDIGLGLKGAVVYKGVPNSSSG